METIKTAGNLSYRFTFSKIKNSYIEYAYLLNSLICDHSRIKPFCTFLFWWHSVLARERRYAIGNMYFIHHKLNGRTRQWMTSWLVIGGLPLQTNSTIHSFSGRLLNVSCRRRLRHQVTVRLPARRSEPLRLSALSYSLNWKGWNRILE